MLIDKRAISPAEKFYYHSKYVSGPARQTLDGTFYRNENEANQDAWKKLNHRFGQPFAIQGACHDAMPHVKGLDILNDREENLSTPFLTPKVTLHSSTKAQRLLLNVRISG